jgi:hypothetical protein
MKTLHFKKWTEGSFQLIASKDLPSSIYVNLEMGLLRLSNNQVNHPNFWSLLKWQKLWSPSSYLPCERFWVKAYNQCHAEIPGPQKLWNIKCVFFKLLGLGVICYTSMENQFTFVLTDKSLTQEAQFLNDGWIEYWVNFCMKEIDVSAVLFSCSVPNKEKMFSSFSPPPLPYPQWPGTKPRAPHLLSKHSTTQAHPRRSTLYTCMKML